MKRTDLITTTPFCPPSVWQCAGSAGLVALTQLLAVDENKAGISFIISISHSVCLHAWRGQDGHSGTVPVYMHGWEMDPLMEVYSLCCDRW